MVKIDLITGFLGSGKTTFLKKYARYHMDRGEKLCILENDFGAVNIDMMLIQDLLGEQCDMEMVAGGCDKDCHIRRFKTKLIAMGMCGYQRVIVEPSGIFDVDEFFDVLREEPLDRWYEIDNVITIVDATLSEDLSEGASYLLGSQVAHAGSILCSKVTESPYKKEEITAHIKNALQEIKCNRNFSDVDSRIIYQDWESFTEEDYGKISSSGYVNASYEKLSMEEEEIFQSLYYMNLDWTKEDLIPKIEKLFENSSYGKIIRVKGFLCEGDSWLEINATKDGISMKEIEKGQKVIIVIGESLEKESIEAMITEN